MPSSCIIEGRSKNYPLEFTNLSIVHMERETHVRWTAILHIMEVGRNAMESKQGTEEERLQWVAQEIGMQEVLALLVCGLEGHRMKHAPREAPVTFQDASDIFDDCGGMSGLPQVLDRLGTAIRDFFLKSAPQEQGGASKPGFREKKKPTKAQRKASAA